MWFTKAKRAQTSDDFETWIEGGVVPTLNAFDCGDTRATVVIVMREREGKRGGGKGPLLSDRSFTLSTSNFQTLFIIDGTRVGDVRVYEDTVMQTVIQRWGTGGGNVPAIQAENQTVRRLTPTECERLQGFPDGWTEGQADSHRYKQLGNAVAVPVVQWLINRTTGKD
jgi:site-specific DNA-cytosine methylase